MKTLLTLIMMITSSISFAGGSGGGGVMASMMSTNGGGVFAEGNGSGTMGATEIVYHMGEQDGVVKFAYAQLVNNQWQVTKHVMQKPDLSLDPSAKLALIRSSQSRSWQPIQ